MIIQESRKYRTFLLCFGACINPAGADIEFPNNIPGVECEFLYITNGTASARFGEVYEPGIENVLIPMHQFRGNPITFHIDSISSWVAINRILPNTSFEIQVLDKPAEITLEADETLYIVSIYGNISVNNTRLDPLVSGRLAKGKPGIVHVSEGSLGFVIKTISLN